MQMWLVNTAEQVYTTTSTALRSTRRTQREEEEHGVRCDDEHGLLRRVTTQPAARGDVAEEQHKNGSKERWCTSAEDERHRFFSTGATQVTPSSRRVSVKLLPPSDRRSAQRFEIRQVAGSREDYERSS
ncbi:MAG: hypothetical protein CMI53_00250 [Parcubacteria group bacterium]|nr:hypothetical protein [Parcubacteria group bacterium]